LFPELTIVRVFRIHRSVERRREAMIKMAETLAWALDCQAERNAPKAMRRQNDPTGSK